MESSKIVEINSSTIDRAIQVFSKAMEFPIDVEQSILATAKLFLAHNNLFGFAIEHKNNFIGFGGLIGMAGNTAWIPYVGVDPDFQGLGFGKILMKNLLAKAKEKNWISVELVASKKGFPLYKKFDFRTEYPVAIFEIKSIDSSQDTSYLKTTSISHNKNLPKWLLQFDRDHLGIDRSNIFDVHNLDNITLISQKDQGYGLIYGQRIGPVISNSLELARDIILHSFKLGVTSFVVRYDEKIVDFLSQYMTIEMQTNTDGTKMVYGKDISSKSETIICLRSMAFG